MEEPARTVKSSGLRARGMVKSIPGRAKSQGKGPEARACLRHSRSTQPVGCMV